MIKLTDLLRELDIRKGSLGQAFVNDNQLRESFFYNFDLIKNIKHYEHRKQN